MLVCDPNASPIVKPDLVQIGDALLEWACGSMWDKAVLGESQDRDWLAQTA